MIGDMAKPSCSLCARVELPCVYPTSRKASRAHKKPKRTEPAQGRKYCPHSQFSCLNDNCSVPGSTQNDDLGFNGGEYGESSGHSNITGGRPASPVVQSPPVPGDARNHSLKEQTECLPQRQQSPSAQSLANNDIPFLASTPDFVQYPFMVGFPTPLHLEEQNNAAGGVVDFDFIGYVIQYCWHL